MTGIRIITSKRIVTSGPTVIGKWGRQTDLDGPLRCSSLTLQHKERQREHRKLKKQ
jgi:hypothetical protein